MLYYIYTVLQEMLVISTMLTLMAAWIQMEWGKTGARYLYIGMTAGTVVSLIMAVIKNTTKVFRSTYSIYSMWLCFAIVLAALLFIVSALFQKRKARFAVTGVVAALFAGTYIVYKGGTVFGFLFNFDTNGKSILSADYAVRLVGWLIGAIILYIYIRNLYKCANALARPALAKRFVLLTALSVVVRCMEPVMKPWVSGARKNLPAFLPKYVKADYPWAFPFTKWVYNNDLMFALLAALLGCIIAIMLFIRDMRIHDPYSNPAQLRKLKATGRRNRRRALTIVMSAVVAAVFMTAVKAWDSREIELSAPEEYTVTDVSVIVPITQVEDGHLHRFEYKTESGVNVRWIVIKKPNSSVFGVGLDACDVCGNAGYYERDNQVICKRCDVVMNKSTIGFKGGCNPIPLSYTVEDGALVFSLADLNAAEKEFK